MNFSLCIGAYQGEDVIFHLEKVSGYYLNILRATKATGFDGFIGLECGFTKDTDTAVAEFKDNIMVRVN